MGYTQQDRDQLGFEQSRPVQITVGASSVEVSRAKLRKNVYIRNTSTGGQVINVVFSNDSAATVSTGFQLNPNESITDSQTEGYNPWTGKITAISSAAAGTLQVFERWD
jgi:hypothetical protein